MVNLKDFCDENGDGREIIVSLFVATFNKKDVSYKLFLPQEGDDLEILEMKRELMRNYFTSKELKKFFDGLTKEQSDLLFRRPLIRKIKWDFRGSRVIMKPL